MSYVNERDQRVKVVYVAGPPGPKGDPGIAADADLATKDYVAEAIEDAVLDAGAGDVVGPASAVVDNRLVRFNGTTGKSIQSSPVLLSDSGDLDGVTTLNGRNLTTDSSKLDGITPLSTPTNFTNVSAALNAATTTIPINGQRITGSSAPQADGDLTNRLYVANAISTAISEVGAGNVVGPASTVDNRLVRFDGTTGKLLQTSGITIDDSNNCTGLGTLNGVTITSIVTTSTAVGGNLTGTVGNATVTGVRGVTGSASAPSTGQVWTATSTSAASWQTPTTYDLTTKANRRLTTKAISGTTYTLILTDGDEVDLLCTNASIQTVTVPTNASVAFAIGTVITFGQLGAGKITMSPVSGTVTIRKNSAVTFSSNGQYTSISMRKIGTDEWLLSGDLELV